MEMAYISLILLFAAPLFNNVMLCFSAPNHDTFDISSHQSIDDLADKFFYKLSKDETLNHSRDVPKIVGGVQNNERYTFCRNGAECHRFPTTTKPINAERTNEESSTVDELIKRIFDTNSDRTIDLTPKNVKYNQYSICRDNKDCYVFPTSRQLQMDENLDSQNSQIVPIPASAIVSDKHVEKNDGIQVEDLLRKIFRAYEDDEQPEKKTSRRKRDVATNTLPQPNEVKPDRENCMDNFLEKLVQTLATRVDISPNPKNETNSVYRNERSVEDFLDRANGSVVVESFDELIDRVFGTISNTDEDKTKTINKDVESLRIKRSEKTLDDLLQQVFNSKPSKTCGPEKQCVPSNTCNNQKSIKTDEKSNCEENEICCLEKDVIAQPLSINIANSD